MNTQLMMARARINHAITYATDTFAVNSISSYTQIADSLGSWTIGSNICTSGGNQSILTRSGVSFANGKVQAVLSKAGDAGVALRVADTNNYYLAAVCDASSTSGITNLVILYKRVGGTFTSLGTAPVAFVRGTQHTLALEATGTSLTLSFDGVTKVTAVDSAITAAGACGMRSGNPVSGTQTFNSFTWP